MKNTTGQTYSESDVGMRLTAKKIQCMCPGHMTNMAAMPIYGEKTFKKIFFSGTKRPMTLEIGMQQRVLEYYQVCSNDDLG